MLYTKSAYTLVLDSFRRGECVVDNVQDLSMCKCAAKHQIKLFHSPLFNFHRPMSTFWNGSLSPNEFYRQHSGYGLAAAITFL